MNAVELGWLLFGTLTAYWLGLMFLFATLREALLRGPRSLQRTFLGSVLVLSFGMTGNLGAAVVAFSSGWIGPW